MGNKFIIVPGLLILAVAAYAGMVIMKTHKALTPDAKTATRDLDDTSPPTPITLQEALKHYSGIIADHTANMEKYAKPFLGDNEGGRNWGPTALEGVYFAILDLDFDGQPELMVAYSGDNRFIYTFGYYLYGLKNQQPILLRKEENEDTSYGSEMTYFRLREKNGQTSFAFLHEVFLMEDLERTLAIRIVKLTLDKANLMVSIGYSFGSDEKRFTRRNGRFDEEGNRRDLYQRWEARQAEEGLVVDTMPGLYTKLVEPNQEAIFHLKE
ncbi:MAG: hypothetical protein M0R76_12455 [Proteobacteria bacterium]|nr:hypothetical protein [Pseudomonadota bacterium]